MRRIGETEVPVSPYSFGYHLKSFEHAEVAESLPKNFVADGAGNLIKIPAQILCSYFCEPWFWKFDLR